MEQEPDVIVDPKTGEAACSACQGRLYLTHSKRVAHVENESRWCPGSTEDISERAGVK